MTDNMQGKTVLIVGASSGIGRAVAHASNQQGAHVILSSRSREKLEGVRAELAMPDKATVLPFDYLNREEVRTAIAPLETIHHLVIPAVADENAKRSRFVEISDEVMRASFDKFWGQVYVTQSAAPKMPAGGSITLFSSVAAFRPPQPQSGLSVMNAVQGAIATLGRSLARELAPIRVNVMVPGVVLTNVWQPEERESLTKWMESSLDISENYQNCFVTSF